MNYIKLRQCFKGLLGTGIRERGPKKAMRLDQEKDGRDQTDL
jgi:hypothetical protein